jgi:very-short-patch-repair endonuclease
MQNFNTDIIIKKCKEIHYDKYDYSETEYLNKTTKIKIYCNNCKKYFFQEPRFHLKGAGCFTCASILRSNIKKEKSKKDFLERAYKVHKDKYEYSKSIFNDMKSKIIIICKKHKIEFLQTPAKHISCNQGCKLCGNDSSSEKQKLPLEVFIEKSNKIHMNIFDYSKINYINSHTKIQLFCNIHKINFEITPYDHMRGTHCQKCAITKCASIKFNNGKNKFKTQANIKHCDKYDYSKFEYFGWDKKGIIICKKCNSEFNQTPNSHLQGTGCPFCKNKTEKKLLDALKKDYPDVIYQFKQNWCKNKTFLPFDFALEDKKIIIELDGRQHFETVWDEYEKTHKNDLFKMSCANKNGFIVIRIIQEDVYYNKYDWFDELKNNINNIKNINIFMCKNNEYDIFK